MQDNLEVSPYIQKQRALYLEKNTWLDANYERVEPHAFYREIFPVGSFERKGHFEDGKGNGIGISIHDAFEVANEPVDTSEQKEDENSVQNQEKCKVHCYVINDGFEKLDELICQKFSIITPVSYF